MARIAGINIPPQQHSEIGLTAIFGIGRTLARKICEACGIAYSKKVKEALDALLDPYIIVPGEIKITNEPGQVLVDYQKPKRPYVHRKKVKNNGSRK